MAYLLTAFFFVYLVFKYFNNWALSQRTHAYAYTTPYRVVAFPFYVSKKGRVVWKFYEQYLVLCLRLHVLFKHYSEENSIFKQICDKNNAYICCLMLFSSFLLQSFFFPAFFRWVFVSKKNLNYWFHEKGLQYFICTVQFIII